MTRGASAGPMFIYLVTCVEKTRGTSGTRDTRTWGWFYDFEEACRSVLENHTDMFEGGWYEYAVIEGFEEGLCNLGLQKAWFRADYPTLEERDPVVSKVSRPEFAEGVCNWGMA